MAQIYVDVDALTELGARIEYLRTRLDTHDDFPHLSATQLGDAGLAEKVHTFEGNWSDGLWRIRQGLASARDALGDAVAAYEVTDTAVDDALGTGPPPGTTTTTTLSPAAAAPTPAPTTPPPGTTTTGTTIPTATP